MASRSKTVLNFLGLSEALTGFAETDLLGTGLLDTYFMEVRDIVGERRFGTLLLRWQEIPPGPIDDGIQAILADPEIGPVARNIISLWYSGNWNQLPGEWRQQYGASAHDRTRVVSAQAYQEGFIWRAVDAHPPAAKSPGFGTWTAPPGEPGEFPEIDDEWHPDARGEGEG